MRVARRTILLLLVATGAAIAAFQISGTPLALADGPVCSPSLSTLTVDHSSVPADGSWDATLTATCLDSLGNPISGRAMVLLQSGGFSTINPGGSTPTNFSGVATFQVSDATPEGPITYTAADLGGSSWNQTVQVTFVYCDTTIVPEAAIGGGSLAVLLGGGLFFWQFRRRRRLVSQSRS